MTYDLAKLNSEVMDVEEMRYILSKITLVEKLIYSGVTKLEVKAALKMCSNLIQLNTWLESVLKHWVVKRSPDRTGWDKYVRAEAVKRDIVYLFENTYLLGPHNREELETWADSED